MGDFHNTEKMGKVTIAEWEEHVHPFGDTKFAAKNIVQYLPPAYLSQKRLDYDTRSDDNPVYVGFNTRTAATSDSDWILQKLTYDSSNRVTLVQIAQDSWDNRTGASYG